MQRVVEGCNYESCDAFCDWCNGTVNLHLRRGGAAVTEAVCHPNPNPDNEHHSPTRAIDTTFYQATVTGGCTLVRDAALKSRLSFGKMRCRVEVCSSFGCYLRGFRSFPGCQGAYIECTTTAMILAGD